MISIMLAVGTAIGFRFQAGPAHAVAMVLIAVLFGFAISWIFALIGTTVKDAETAQLASFVLIFPLTFASSAFVAVDTMPGWLQVFSRHQPVTLVVNAARELALGSDGNGAVWKVLLWSSLLLAVFVPLSLRQYRRRSA